MGEYVKKGNVVIKIGVMDEMFYTRETLLKLKEEGFKGYFNGKYDNSLEKTLKSEETLYQLRTYEDIEELKNNSSFGNSRVSSKEVLENAEFVLPAIGVKHKKVHLIHNRLYHYVVDCKHIEDKLIKAKIVGMRYREKSGLIQGRTIFECACCGAMFNIDHYTAMLIRTLQPNLKGFIVSDGDSHANSLGINDLYITELLEEFVERYDYNDFYTILSGNSDIEKINQMLKGYNYPTIYNYYIETKKHIKMLEEIKKQVLKGLNNRKS